MLYINEKIILKSRPEGLPELNNFDLKKEKITSLEYGEVIIEVIWLSLDPYMRGRMSEAKSYALPIEIGNVITGGAVGKIIESKCPRFNVGEIVEGFTIGWQKYARLSTNNIRKINPNKRLIIETSLNQLC